MKNLILSLLFIPVLAFGLVGENSDREVQNIPERSLLSNSGFEASLQSVTTYSDAETATMTIASPCVVTIADTTDLRVGQPFQFTNSGGALPTGVSASTTYYVTTIVSSTTFRFSATLGGSDVNSSGTQSGTHTFRPIEPMNGTGGTVCSSYTATKSSSNAVDGTTSLAISKPASNCLGSGTAITVTLPGAQWISSDFIYYLASGTYSPGSLTTDSDQEIWVYDVTNSRRIPLSGPYKIDGTVQTTNRLNFSSGFQTSSGSASYRILFHTATNSASAYNLNLDNLLLRIKAANKGNVTTEWTSFTPSTVTMTAITSTAFWRRVGSSMEISYRGIFTGGSSGTFEMAIPTGYHIDSAKLPNFSSSVGSYGPVFLYDASVGTRAVGTVTGGTADNLLRLVSDNTTSGVTSTTPWTWAVDDQIYFTASVPIVGWGATGNISNEDGRRVYLQYTGNAGTVLTADSTNIDWTTKVVDSHGAWNGTTFTAPRSDWYYIAGGIQTTGATTINVYARVNGVNKTYLSGNQASAVLRNLVGNMYLNAGDTLVFRVDNGATLTNGSQTCWLSISSASGGSTVTPTESVAAFYRGQPTGTLNGSINKATLPTKQQDTHAAYNSGTYTVPVTATYSIAAQLHMIADFIDDGNAAIYLYKNGAVLVENQCENSTVMTQFPCPISVVGVPLVAGDTIDVRSSTNGSSTSYSSTASRSFFSIVKTGP